MKKLLLFLAIALLSSCAILKPLPPTDAVATIDGKGVVYNKLLCEEGWYVYYVTDDTNIGYRLETKIDLWNIGDTVQIINPKRNTR